MRNKNLFGVIEYVDAHYSSNFPSIDILMRESHAAFLFVSLAHAVFY